MFSFSHFEHNYIKSLFKHIVPRSNDYKVTVNGTEVDVYSCRISAYPFNTWWPKHQRPVNQTETASYVNLVSDEKLVLEIEPENKNFGKIMLKPYSKGVKTAYKDGKIVFELKENGFYVLELDDYHNCLYIFNNKPISRVDRESVTYYFGPGVHFVGKLTLKSHESVYVDKDALCYGCIYAENAEDIRIFGNGIFDDSGEERFDENCYEGYTNGNIKFYDCKNIKIEGVGFTNSAIWCVNLFHCFGVEMEGVKVFGQWRYNTDGVDIVNSQRIHLNNCFIHSFDDTVTVKGIDRYCETDNADILTENCVLWCDWGKTCEIGLETECKEYRNITFRNIDIIRGGNTALDIQNGDCAEVKNVLYENINIEYEKFYTPEVYQQNDGQIYEAEDQVITTYLLCIANPRFREAYAFLGVPQSDAITDFGRYACSHNITVKNVNIFYDENIPLKDGKRDIRVYIASYLKGVDYYDISIENITVNGVKQSADDLLLEVNNTKNFSFK